MGLAISVLLLFTATIHTVRAQQFVQYKVQVAVDGSAQWIITQASDLNGTIDSWRGFQLRVDNLVSSAVNLTQRQMSVDLNSLQLNTVWENQSQTTEYQFTWLNFSIVQDGRITIGDVFGANGFFSQLYGDGELQIIYPQNYTIASVSPQPNGGNVAPDTLDWLGTEFFVKSNPRVVLVPLAAIPPPNQTLNGGSWQLYAIVVSALAVVAAASIWFYLFRYRNSKRSETALANRPAQPVVESEEEKIVRALQASGGSAFQSAITDQFRFSKAKTSQLLTAMEKKGMVRRYKKGRDKIVTLTEQGKGESS